MTKESLRTIPKRRKPFTWGITIDKIKWIIHGIRKENNVIIKLSTFRTISKSKTRKENTIKIGKPGNSYWNIILFSGNIVLGIFFQITTEGSLGYLENEYRQYIFHKETNNITITKYEKIYTTLILEQLLWYDYLPNIPICDTRFILC